jgi:hypothetical protein
MRILFIPQIRKIYVERTLFIPQIGKIEAKRSLFIPQIPKIEAERTLFIPQFKDRSGAKKTVRTCMHQLQNFISQKICKLFEPNFQRVFLYTYTASLVNLSSLALS